MTPNQYDPSTVDTTKSPTPLHESELEVTKEFTISFTHKMPNWWWRLWQFLLFGSRWKKL